MQFLIDGREPVRCAPQQPVGHGLPGEHQPLAVPLLTMMPLGLFAMCCFDGIKILARGVKHPTCAKTPTELGLNMFL